MSRNKAAAFAAVPDVLRQGLLVATEPGPRDKRRLGHFFAAPIKMANKDYVVVVLVRSDAKSHRMYVHEVALREKLQAPFKTGAAAEVVGLTGGPGAIKRVVQRLFAVKQADVSKAVENGEPLVVYHGTAKDFTVFNAAKTGSHFGSLDQASHALSIKASRLPIHEFAELPLLEGGQPGYITATYLSIKNPKRIIDPRTEKKWEQAVALAKSQGHDGIVYRNEWEGGTTADSWVAFRQVTTGLCIGMNGRGGPQRILG